MYPLHPNEPDRAGQTYGTWTVIAPSAIRHSAGHYWQCVCSCGTTRLVTAATLVKHRSCGCANAPYSNRPGPKPKYSTALTIRVNGVRESARRRGLIFSLRTAEVIKLFFQNCFYCTRPPAMPLKAGCEILRSTLDRKDSNFGYTTENTVACCLQCNVGKRDLSADAWIAWLDETARLRATLH